MSIAGEGFAGESVEAPDAAGVFRIWPGDGAAPGSEGWHWQQSTMPIPWADTDRRLSRNVVVPTVTAFRPAPGTANGTALIIAPGGAFHFLMIDHEGYDMARWLTGLGVTAFVLKYRLGRTPDADADLAAFREELHRKLGEARQTDTAPPAAEVVRAARLLGEEDGRQAIRFVRERAADFGIAPDRIGICGFSAGGGVTVGAVMEHDAASRPDFAAAIYPAYRSEMAFPADAPPLFIATADNDKSVAPISSTRLYEAWHKAGKASELHVFGNGAHGFGMGKAGLLSDAWTDLLRNWMAAQGFLSR
jgi:acetyl esterase/lipase